MTTTSAPVKRMAWDQRKAMILRTARSVLERDGIERFSLEQVAREAGVAATLPRHYFFSRDGLLVAALIDLLHEITDVLLVADPALTLEERLRAYIEQLARNPWSHSIWLASARVHPEVDEHSRQTRRRLIEASFRRPWDDLAPDERVAMSGWIGYVDGAVMQWIEEGAEDQQMLLTVLLDGAKRHGVVGA